MMQDAAVLLAEPLGPCVSRMRWGALPHEVVQRAEELTLRRFLLTSIPRPALFLQGWSKSKPRLRPPGRSTPSPVVLRTCRACGASVSREWHGWTRQLQVLPTTARALLLETSLTWSAICRSSSRCAGPWARAHQMTDYFTSTSTRADAS
jgi:hypothetical protein